MLGRGCSWSVDVDTDTLICAGLPVVTREHLDIMIILADEDNCSGKHMDDLSCSRFEKCVDTDAS